MAGLRVGVPVLLASIARTLNIVARGTDTRIVVDAAQSLAQVRLLAPSMLLLNAKAVFEDFRNLPLGNLTAKSHTETPDDPNSDPVASQVPVTYIPGWTGRWPDWHTEYAVNGPLGSTAYAGLTPATSRDSDRIFLVHPEVPHVFPPPSSGRMLRTGAPPGILGAFGSLSMDAVDPNEPNVDLTVKFRLWEPGFDLVTPWHPAYYTDGSEIPSNVRPGDFQRSSNQLMLILSMDNGLVETGNENEVYGYALRNNWDEGPWPTSWGVPGFAWELVRFSGIQDIIEGQIATELRERVFKYRQPRPGKKDTVIWKRRRYFTARDRKHYLAQNPDQQAIKLGEGTVVRVTSGWGDLYRPLVRATPDGQIVSAGPNPAGKGTINWNEIPGSYDPSERMSVQGQWLWARMRKSVDGAKVRIQAKVWRDGYTEPATWLADILDDTVDAIQGGYTGFGYATPIHGEPGMMGGLGVMLGPADIDQVIVQIAEVPVGTSVHFEALPAVAACGAITPDFINTGTLTRTWWDEYTVGTTPGNWFILRPQIGPAPDAGAVTNNDLKGKSQVPDRRENFLLKVDPDLDPTKFLGDRGTVSLEHVTRDLSDWIVWDPDEDFARYINPDMPRDGLAWNEPYPGTPFQGHDGQVDDAEVLTKFQADTWDQSVTFWLRGTGVKGHENGYVITPVTESLLPVTQDDPALEELEMEVDLIGWRVYKYLNGERVELGSMASPWQANIWYWARIRIEGSSERQADRRKRIFPTESALGQPTDRYPYGGVKISLKFWPDGVDESSVPWSEVLDDGYNNGFTGYRLHWDEYDEYRLAPNARYNPLAAPIDRGFFAIGSPSIGNTQRYAEVHVLASRIPRLDSSAYAGTVNLLSTPAATGDAAKWVAENIATQTVVHSDFDGAQALELISTNATREGAKVRLVCSERVAVTPGQGFVALATLDNFQHQWSRTWFFQKNDWYLLNYRRHRVGVRWFDADGNVVSAAGARRMHVDAAYDQATTDSMRSGFTGARPPGAPRYVGEGYYPPETGYLDVGDPRTTQRSWYDLSQTRGPGDPYAGFAFPADRPQPFRWQEKWRWWSHAGNLAFYVWQSWYYDDDEVLQSLDHIQQTSDNIGWSLPMIHVAPPGATQAAVVIELENAQQIETVDFDRRVVVDYISSNNRVVPGRPSPGYHEERYRVGEVALFPALLEPAYASWNPAPGQFALPPAPVDVQMTMRAFEPEVHGHVSAQVDAPASAAARMFKPSAHTTTPQYSRPMQDDHDGSWTREDNTTNFIWSAIDDLIPDDRDYAQSGQMPEDDLYVAQLTRMRNPDPDSTEKFLLHVRYRRRGAANTTLRVALYQGEVPIAEWEEEIGTSRYATVVHELTSAQVAAINDYADLRIRLVGDVVPV